MPLPPTRYIDAGAGVPLANPQTAMATGEAMARMGETIAQVGEKGFRLAEQVRKVEEAGKLSAFFSNADEEAANFSTDLMTRADTANWPTEWREKSTELRERMKSLGISPEGMARAEIEFGEWSSSRSINFETQAATKALQMGRAQVSNALQYYGSRGDLDSYRREAARAKESGVIDPVEYDQALRDGDTIAAQSALMEDIEADPQTALEQLKSGEFLQNYPGATTDMVERGIREAEVKMQRAQVEIAGALQDEISAGNLTDPAQLDAKATGLRPRQLEILKAEIMDRQDKAVMAARATPSYQNKVIGQVSDALANFDPADADQAVQLDALIRQLPTGANKSHYRAILSKKLSGEPEDDTALDINLKLADDAFKGGWFKKPAEITTSQAIDAGFLKDPDKLKAVGFSEDQVEAIIEAKTDKARKDLVQAEWTKRGKAAENVDPMVWATAEAIRNGQTTVKMEDPNARWAELETYGRVKSETIKWANANPNASVNDIRQKMLELAAPGKREAFLDTAFDAADFDALPEINPTMPGLPGGNSSATDSLLPPKP